MGKPSTKRMRAERAPEHAGSIRKSGFIMVRPLEGGKTPIIIESWYEVSFSSRDSCRSHDSIQHTRASRTARLGGGNQTLH